MPSLPHTQELLDIAKRVVWFKTPEETLGDQVLFLCHLMTYTLPEDFIAVAKTVPPSQFQYALDHAPAGIFDARSWAYWNIKYGREPVPPLPERKIP